MNALDYKVVENCVGTMHIIVIDCESLATTRPKEVLAFAKPRGLSKIARNQLKNAVRACTSLSMRGGN